MDKLIQFLQRLWHALIRSTRKFGVWWRTTFQSQSRSGKILFGGASLLVACCLCVIPIAILSPSSADSEQQDDEPLAKAIETDTPFPATLAPTETPLPTNTLPPSSETPQPTVTPSPVQEATAT